MNEQENYEVIKKPEDNRWKNFKIGVGVFIFISWMILIGLWSASKISLKIPLIIAIIITILGVVALFFKQIYTRLKKSEESLNNVIQPISKEEVLQILNQTIEEQWDQIEKPNGIKEISTETIGNNQIYKFKVKLHVSGLEYYVLINATYPNTIPTITPVETTKNPTLTKLVNAKSQNPKDDPQVEISDEGVDNFGHPIRKTTRITPAKKEEKKKEDVIV